MSYDISTIALGIGDHYAHPVLKTFGLRVKQLREDRGFTQKDAALKAKMSQPQWANLEASKRLPEGPTLIRIAKAISSTVDELLVGADEEYDELRSDLIRQRGDQQFDPSQEGAQANVPAEARVELERLRTLVEKYQTASRKVLELVDDLDAASTALEELGTVKEGKASRVRRTRKAS